MLAIFKREFKSFFQTVIGWLFLAITLALFGLYFYVNNLINGSPYLSNTLSRITFIFLITVPILTMRILAEERKSKTDQLILTSPVTVGKIVIGKYLAMAAVFSITAAIFCITPLILSRFGDIPYGECYVAILGYWLFGLTCIAIGTFISAITESQVIAAVLTFGMLFLGYMMGGITSLISSTGNLLTKVLNCYNLTQRMDSFFSGFLDMKALIYYVSLILLFLFLAVQAIQKRRWSISSKQIKTGVFSTGFIAVAFVAVVVVNLIGAQLPEAVRSIDVTSQKLYSITDDTKKLLEGLDEDITIFVLAKEEDQDATLKKTLERYRNASKHITVEYKDPAVSPSFYMNYSDTALSKNSLIIAGSKRHKVINYNDIYKTEVDRTTFKQKVTGYDAEGQMSSAITYVTNEKNPVIYQIAGHDEVSLGATFTDAASKLNVTLKSLNLLESEKIPEDAEGLILNAPAKDLSEDDVTKILDYLKQGGKALIVKGYTGQEMPNFNKILAAYGASVVDGVIVEKDTTAFYQQPYYLMPKATKTTATANASGNYIFMPYAQGIAFPKSESADAEEKENSSGTTFEEILATSDLAYSKVNVKGMKSFEKEDGDLDGPFTLGLHISKAIEQKEESTELYLFASGGLLTDEVNQMSYGNNAVLFTGILSQFVDSEVSSVIPVKSYNMAQLTINQASIVVGGMAVAVLVPVFLLAIGIVIWVRRRRK